MSTDAQPVAHRVRWPHGRLLWVLLAVGLAAVLADGVDRAFFSDEPQAARPELQRILDGLVSGPATLAPGATAYVSGPTRPMWMA